jgi:dTMP kinase
MRGLFITFEGPDGSGKSTQIKLLSEVLEEKGIPYIQTREPGGTLISDKIREIILDPEHDAMKNETEVLLYAASRAQHVREKVMPALEQGKVVLCDRFVDASVAYQGYGLELPVEVIQSVNAFATAGVKPHRTYMIDLSPDEGRVRMLKRTGGQSQGLDRIEQKELDYHKRVRNGFHTIYNENKDRICLVDGSTSIGKVSTLIKEDFFRFYQTYK